MTCFGCPARLPLKRSTHLLGVDTVPLHKMEAAIDKTSKFKQMTWLVACYVKRIVNRTR